MWDLYCFQCSLQFDKKSIYDIHLSIIHNYKSRTQTFIDVIKSEPEEIESNNIQSRRTEEQELRFNH